MDWFEFLSSDVGAGFPGPLDEQGGASPEVTDRWPAVWGIEEPTAADLWLVDVVYGTIAPCATCSACGAALGRRLRVTAWPTLRGRLLWRVSVRTRCWGWRRHAHVANVTRSFGDVVLGSFRGSAR